nr:MAG TPA: hypothetical protein [Caudoviricetes sp.]
MLLQNLKFCVILILPNNLHKIFQCSFTIKGVLYPFYFLYILF